MTIETVDVKSKKILSMKVTDDQHVCNSKTLPEAVENIIESDRKLTIDKIFADRGPYNNNDIFRYQKDNGIFPCIKARKNARV